MNAMTDVFRQSSYPVGCALFLVSLTPTAPSELRVPRWRVVFVFIIAATTRHVVFLEKVGGAVMIPHLREGR